MNTTSTRHLWSLGLCAALALTACSTQTSDSDTTAKSDNNAARPPAEIVKQRASERWDALLAADYAKAYSYLAPTVRTVRSLEGYKLGLNVRDGQPSPWKKYTMGAIQCDSAEVCKATVSIEAELRMPKFAGMTATADAQEEWVLQDGQWYLYLR